MRAFNLKSQWADWHLQKQREQGQAGVQRRFSRFFPSTSRRYLSSASSSLAKDECAVEEGTLQAAPDHLQREGSNVIAEGRAAENTPSGSGNSIFAPPPGPLVVLPTRMSKLKKYLQKGFRVVAPHILLYLSTVLYTLVGAIVFHRIELPFEIAHLRSHSAAVSEAQDTLSQLLAENGEIFGRRGRLGSDEEQMIIHRLNSTIDTAIDNIIYSSFDAFSNGIRLEDLKGMRKIGMANANASTIAGSEAYTTGVNTKWNFHSSLFFSATLLTSIGYGNLTPISPYGRLFCIVYAFSGIPLTLITIADVAKFLADIIMGAAAKLRKRVTRNQEYRPGIKENGLPVDGNMVDGELSAERGENESEVVTAALFQPGFWTKMVVVILLLIYMSTAALVFSNLQESWTFLDALYFTLITLVTIGFGDFCPSSEDHYGGWILFIFAGLILSTLTVDLVGSAYIEKIHTFGRQLDFGAFLSIMGKDTADSARLVHQLYAGAYIPSDLRVIPYIDQQLQANYYYLNRQLRLERKGIKRPSLFFRRSTQCEY